MVGLAIRKELLRRRGAIATNMTRGLVARLDSASADHLDDLLDRLGIQPSVERFDPLWPELAS